MSDVCSGFVANCIACYKPGANITVDEQLFPTTQYLANKPDKFGIKFWLAADVETKYLLKGFPYLGKDHRPHQGPAANEHQPGWHCQQNKAGASSLSSAAESRAFLQQGAKT